jgi:alginate O-acetyltransferase complex protein AlgJ
MKTKTVKGYSLIICVIFLGILFTPLFIRVLNLEDFQDKSKSEKRMLATKPLFDIEKLDPFPKGYELWFNDHFYQREQFLFINNLYNFHLGKSPSPNNVVLGKQQWLYYNVIERALYEGDINLADDSIALIRDELSYRSQEMAKRGIKLYVMIAPIKKEIYPEFLPNYIQRASLTITDKIINSISKDKSINLITCKGELLEAKKNRQVYFKYDNHWNAYGAYIAYQKLINRIGQDFPEINKTIPISIKSYIKKGGNLADMVMLETMLSENSAKICIENPKATDAKKGNYPIINDFSKDEFEIAKQTQNKSLPKALIIRDSFFGDLIPMVSEHFSRSVFIFDAWQYGFNLNIVEAEKPDVVILEVFEPHILNILNNLSHKQKK